VSNQPRDDNPARTVRVDDRLWQAAKLAAAANGTTVSDILRGALERYVKRQARP
jgi:antitoxin component of RelBE/YafQ-DinJ toxin-antitoxin module